MPMDEYPLTVEGDWGPQHAKSVKNKLHRPIHFQSKKKSQGGDCVVQYNGKSNSATILFKSSDIRDAVLLQEEHIITIDSQKIKLKVYKPSDAEKQADSTRQKMEQACGNKKPSQDDVAKHINTTDTHQIKLKEFKSSDAEEQADRNGQRMRQASGYQEPNRSVLQFKLDVKKPQESSAVVLENLPDGFNSDVVTILVENITSLSENDFGMEIIPELGKAVVTFKNPGDAGKFLEDSRMHKKFKKSNLRTRAVERSTCVRVENLPAEANNKMLLELYFEKWGGPVEEVITIPAEQAAIITFQEEEARIKKESHSRDIPLGNKLISLVLIQIISDCLKKADTWRMASVVFPAIGTGNLGFPKDLVARIMLTEFQEFNCTNLREVTVIVHPSDKESIQCFTSIFRHRIQGPITKGAHQHSMPKINTSGKSAQTSELVGKVSSPSLGVHTMQLGRVTLEVSSGDITKEKTDAIVNSSNKKFSLKAGVSKAILDAAGLQVEQECLQIVGSSNLQQTEIVTSAGVRPCGNIIHIIGCNGPSYIKDVVFSVLKLYESRQITSVAFPALGTGLGGAKPADVADAMIDAAVGFVKKKKPVHVKFVKFLIFQMNMLADFHQSMVRRSGEEVEEDKCLFAKIKAFFLGESSESPSNEEFVMVGEEIEPAVFQLYEETPKDLKEARGMINSLIVREHLNIPIRDPAIAHFTKEDVEILKGMQRKFTVSVQLEKKGQDSVVTLEGLTRDVHCAESRIRDMIRKVERNENAAAAAARSSLPLHWEDMKGNPVVLVKVTAGSTEYGKVEKEFRRTRLCSNIIEIERVQHSTLWRNYMIKKEELEDKNKHKNNEKHLFHGTGPDNTDQINPHGFNRSYAGAHGAMYGNGSYFAVDPRYSTQGYSNPDVNRHKCMYLAWVLVGDVTQGKRDHLVPPAKSTNSADLYNSVTDSISNPTMFVIFNDVQAYPEYLITFQ